MLERIGREEQILIGLLLVLSFWFLFGMDMFNGLLTSNFLVGYIMFISVYVFLTFRYILGWEVNGKQFISLILIFLALDIVIYPILIPKTGLSALSPEQMASSDVFIYSLLPAVLPHMARYYLTYVVVPVILLAIALYLTSRGFWKKGVRASV